MNFVDTSKNRRRESATSNQGSSLFSRTVPPLQSEAEEAGV